ncbi:BURP domain [Dillenia turbinata]|uniref:BURP domain n=1 Tax=Dillenia turbinata TaxID=194707 RepID=A0AAN8W4P9_9MAGN
MEAEYINVVAKNIKAGFGWLPFWIFYHVRGTRELIKGLQGELDGKNHLQEVKKLGKMKLSPLDKDGRQEKIALQNTVDNNILGGTRVLQLDSTDVINNEEFSTIKGSHDSQDYATDDHGEGLVNLNNQGNLEHPHAFRSSHMDHLDPSLMVFFTLKDLKIGKKLQIYFPNKDSSSSPNLRPREEADSIPFSLRDLALLLQLFSFSQGSPQARAMEDTLRQCELKPIRGETKFCATSLESMLDFTRTVFGPQTNIEVHSTIHLTRPFTPLQYYTILEVPLELSTPKMVACHKMPYPYAVFYCHSQESENKVFKVSLGGENRERVEAIAVCHMDTSQWSHNHVSFGVLGIEAGSSHVCHFFPSGHFVWIPSPTST